MAQMTPQVSKLLEQALSLSVEEQETLVEILKSRLRERRRAELAQDVQAAQKEFAEGRCQPATPAELMKEILS